MDEILYYETIAELYTTLGLPIEQDAPFAIHNLADLHQTVPFKSPIFRTNYYSFVFIKNGKGNYTTDEQTFEYGPRTVYFTNPGHLKGFEMYELEEAYIITLSEAFLKENVHADIFQEFPFLLAETVPPQTLSEAEFKESETLYLQILKEYHGTSTFKYRMIGNLFVVLLLKIKERFWSDYQPIDEGDRSSQIVKNFKEALEAHYKDLAAGKMDYQYQAQDYAKLQQLNPNYFSQVIKSKTGKSISQWMAEKTIAQANAFLKHSQLSIKEIAYRLGYVETAHFSNFYKKHTQMTASKYRKQHQSN
ncbi:MAG: AraC family transcriptional regulator [Bacteroidota bacterium]